MSNLEWRFLFLHLFPLNIRCWTFDVRCSSFFSNPSTVPRPKNNFAPMWTLPVFSHINRQSEAIPLFVNLHSSIVHYLPKRRATSTSPGTLMLSMMFPSRDMRRAVSKGNNRLSKNSISSDTFAEGHDPVNRRPPVRHFGNVFA